MLPIVFVALILILSTYFLCFKMKLNFPRGPLALPLIGTLYITKGKPHLAAEKLYKKYGPIIGMQHGGEPAVVLHGAKLIRDAFSEGNLSGRLVREINTFAMGDEFGILQASGSVWNEQRRFSMRTLREFGFGKTSMEDLILAEAQELCDWLKSRDGKPTELKRRFSLAVVNSLWRILTGTRFDHNDLALFDILEKLERTQRVIMEFKSALQMTILFQYPSIAKLFPNFFGWKILEASAKARNDLFDQIIREHSETLDEETPRDFIDVYLKEINRTTNKSSSFHPEIGKNSLRSVLSDLFGAGSDTTAVTLNWTILYLLKNPRVQERIQKEIGQVLGTRPPTLKDKKDLPYVECVMMEVQRRSSILPMGATHACMEDTKLRGYDIPKGTMIQSNLYQAHHDPQVRGDPYEFRPERFLNPDGSCMQRHESLIPFSVGKRVCPGEHLARDTLFIFSTLLLQKFTLNLPAGSAEPSLEPRFGQITLQTEPFEVCMKYRY